MEVFKRTTHLSEILQKSEQEEVLIYKNSNNCNTSKEIENILTDAIMKQKITFPVYMVTVQEMPILSKNIETILEIKHETPQVILLEKGKVKHTSSHKDINLKNIAKI